MNNTFLIKIKNKFSAALRNSCSKDQCTLSLQSLTSYTKCIIDADKYRGLCHLESKLCDLLIFVANSFLIAIACEMKSGRVNASTAVEQIQNGANECDKILESDSASRFIPLLVYGKIQHPSELKVLQARKIRFRGSNYPIIRAKCGSRLVDILKNNIKGGLP